MANLKRSQLKVGNTIAPDGFPPGQIVTIENCTLESFIDGKRKKRWPCWTVRTDAPRPLHKYLICDLGKKDGIILWKKSSIKFAPKGAKLWVERSGLEEMENITGQGPDRFIYSMLVYINCCSAFLCPSSCRKNKREVDAEYNRAFCSSESSCVSCGYRYLGVRRNSYALCWRAHSLSVSQRHTSQIGAG